MLQPGQLRRQRFVGLLQLRQLARLGPHHDEQLVARHLLRRGHPKIKPRLSQSPDERHARTDDHTMKIN
jgi:hypothetical protein